MRKLASIVTVSNKEKMANKDRICAVTFEELGYEAIVPITVNVGDKMVFIQEGSLLPVEEKWEFLRRRCYKEKINKFLIKPMVMGAKENGDKVKSWGLCVGLSEAGLPDNLEPGTDVTELLKIEKYEPEENNRSHTTATTLPWFIKFCYKHKMLRWISRIYKNRKKNQPGFPTEIISKSDETTIQNCKHLLNEFAGKKAYITAKMEGQSFTCTLEKKKKLIICSRNRRVHSSEKDSDFNKAAAAYDIKNKLIKYYKKTGIILVIQGEQCGPGIQGNIYNFDALKWFVFRMKGLINGKWVEYAYPEMLDIANELDLDCVPILCAVRDLGARFRTINDLTAFAEASCWIPYKTFTDWYHHTDVDLWKNCLQHEGIVVKSGDYDKELGRGFSFKVKNCQYAEKSYADMAKIARRIKDENRRRKNV